MASQGGTSSIIMYPTGSGGAFALLYTSLILIILTFAIGAFFRPQTAPVQEAVVEELPQFIPEYSAAISRVEFPALFLSGSTALDPEIKATVVALLLSHDLRAEFTLRPAQQSESELTIARGMHLFRELLAAGVPAGSIEVFSVAADGQSELVELALYHEVTL